MMVATTCLHSPHLFILFTNTMSREFTLRMDSDHYVEEGFLTKTSLSHLLNHAVQNCPRLEKVVGEWTKVGLVKQKQKTSHHWILFKVPDREIAQLEEDCARKGLPVKVLFF